MEFLNAQVPLLDAAWPVALLLSLVASVGLYRQRPGWSARVMVLSAVANVLCYVLTWFPALFDAWSPKDGEMANVAYMVFRSVLPAYLNVFFFSALAVYAFVMPRASTA